MNNITLLEQMGTCLRELSVWQHYTCNNIESYILVSDELNENEILESIKLKIPFIIDLKSLSPYLQFLITECYQSDNEMVYIEQDDEFYTEKLTKTNGEFEMELRKEVIQNGLADYVVFNEESGLITLLGNITLITVFGGILEKINFN